VDEAYAQILEGLVAGDSVVVSAQFLLDSESSRSSDFRRMEAPAEPSSHDHHLHGGGDHD